MADYYDVLGINPSSSLQEIKSSFRKKAKELHPDVQHSSGSEKSAEKMLLLLQAYRILSHPGKREAYDHSGALRFRGKGKSTFNYREFLRERKDDHSSQSKLLFMELLESNSDDAINLYEELISNEDYNMEKSMDRSDYLECIFLLAEEFENRREYERAFEFLKKIYDNEMIYPFFKHFLEEIVDRMKNLVCFKMSGVVMPDLIIFYLNQLVDLKYSNKDIAFFYKKMAELTVKKGDRAGALEYLNLGLKYNKRLGGIKKLKERIGI